MTILRKPISRRQALAATGATMLAAGLGCPAIAAEPVTLRQGYQTNIWGMPTYYLIKSGLLEKHGIKVQEFGVPSGNLTMQQMVAGQVDLGTYAGPSLMIGNSKGGMVGVAVVEQVGKTNAILARKDLNLKKIEDLRGKKVANQVGSSVGNIFVEEIGPAHGLKKGDYQEVRMNVNDMIAAMVAKTVDAMVGVEPYNAIAETDGIANVIMDYWAVDKLPVFMASTPDFAAKHPETIVDYCRAWLEAEKDFKQQPDKVADVIYTFYTSKGYTMSKATFRKALDRVVVGPGFPTDMVPYMQHHAEILIEHKLIKKMPDWKVLLRPDFMEKAKQQA